MKRRLTEQQKKEFKALYYQMKSVDNRAFSLHLLKTYGWRVAMNYAELILKPEFDQYKKARPSLHLPPYRVRESG